MPTGIPNNPPAKPRVETRPRKGYVAVDEKAVERFLEHIRQTGRKTEAARVGGVCPETMRVYRKEHPELEEAIEDAMDEYRDRIAAEIHRRAIEGWEEPVFSPSLGTQIGTVRKFSDKLLELHAKRHMPEYREHLKADVNVSGGVLVVGASAKTAQDWAEQYGGPKKVENENK